MDTVFTDYSNIPDVTPEGEDKGGKAKGKRDRKFMAKRDRKIMKKLKNLAKRLKQNAEIQAQHEREQQAAREAEAAKAQKKAEKKAKAKKNKKPSFKDKICDALIKTIPAAVSIFVGALAKYLFQGRRAVV